MCGICGFIGESKKPVLTYQIITNLLEKSEIIGIDATGFWGTENGVDGSVIYHKEPIRSSEFVKKNDWKLVQKHNPNLLLAHARGASKGVGEPSKNHNNHPFTSLDKSMGLIHNGRVDDLEYHTLKQKYGLQSQCDSEILLRIIESGEFYDAEDLAEFEDHAHPERLAGMRDVFSLINEGHMAVALGERGEDGSRMLWLFRNQHRPLWIVDMREDLGQVFFVSEPSIWEDAVCELSSTNRIFRSQKIIELPTEEIWHFKINSEETCPQKVQRYEVKKSGYFPWRFDGKKHSIIRRNASFNVVTRLDENDRIMPSPNIIRDNFVTPLEPEEISMYDVHYKCNEMISVINNIRLQVEQLIQEKSIDLNSVNSLLQDLDQQKKELNSIVIG